MKRSPCHLDTHPRRLTSEELDCLRSVPKHPRDQALLEVLASGLRVSEVCHLRLDQVHQQGSTVSLHLTGKHGRPRPMPLSGPAQEALQAWLDQRESNSSPYVFCSRRTGGKLSHKSVWAILQRHARKGGLRPIPPYLLRHLQANTEERTPPVPSWPAPAPSVPTVGRQAELRQLQSLVDQRVDVLVLGPHGVGKSHLLSQLHGEKLIRLRRLSPFRPALLSMARALFQAGVFGPVSSVPSAAQPATGETPALAGAGARLGERAQPAPPAGAAPDFDAFLRQHTRTSVSGWTELLLQAVAKDEWVLVLDDLSDLSPASARLLSELRTKFAYVAALPRVPSACRRSLEPCERLVVRHLPRAQARQLVRQQIAQLELEVEDPVLLETRLVYHSGGNPGAMLACLARLRKAPRVTLEAIRQVEPGLNAPQIDLTPAILLPVVLLIATRFLARGIGDTELYVLSGLGSAVVMGAQFFLFRLGRRSL